MTEPGGVGCTCGFRYSEGDFTWIDPYLSPDCPIHGSLVWAVWAARTVRGIPPLDLLSPSQLVGSTCAGVVD